MIAVFGTAEIDGEAMETAARAVASGASVSLFAGVGRDSEGREILDWMVSRLLMFDPALVQSPLPTREAGLAVTKEALLAALSVNSDVRLGYALGPALSDPHAGEAIVGALSSFEPRPVICLAPRLGKMADGAMVSRLEQADILHLGAGEDRFLPRLSSWFKGDLWLPGQWISNRGWTVFFDKNRSDGDVLARLEEARCFGEDGGDPAYDREKVKAALGGF